MVDLEHEVFDTPRPLYFDYNATTPLDPRAASAMAEMLQISVSDPLSPSSLFGNPSSTHVFGATPAKVIVEARKSIRKLINSKSVEEIIFTSGGTESINHGIKGVAFHYMKRFPERRLIITSSIEHIAVLETIDYLVENFGFKKAIVSVTKVGVLDINAFIDILNKNHSEICLVSVMLANGETGAIQPIQQLSSLIRRADSNIVFHTDASQGVGKIKVDVQELGADLLSLAAHKFYGPKGIGALYIRKGVKIGKFIHGAAHEFNQRAGTENVLLLTGMKVAADAFVENDDSEVSYLNYLRGLLQTTISNEVRNNNNDINGLHKIEYKINGPVSDTDKDKGRLPNTLSISFKGVTSSDLLLFLKSSVSCSSASACHSSKTSVLNNDDYSYVLKAMNADPEYAQGTLRLSIGRFTTKEDVKKCAEKVIDSVFQALSQDKPTTNDISVRMHSVQVTDVFEC